MFEEVKEVPATNCAGRINFKGRKIEIYFNSEKNRILPETLDNFRNAIERGKRRALNGCTVVFSNEVKYFKILGFRIPIKVKYVKIYVQPAINNSDLMVVKREDLMRVLNTIR